MKLDVIKLDGGKGGSIELSDDIFGLGDIRGDILQRMVTWQLAKRRAGTHKIQIRNEVSRTSKKMYKQKGTGGARVGSTRNPIWRSGGVALGPQPRDYSYRLPRKVARGALRAALQVKLAEGRVIVVSAFELAEPRTRLANELLAALDVPGKALLIDVRPNDNLDLAMGNLPNVRVTLSSLVTARDVIDAGNVIVTRAAMEHLVRVVTGAAASQGSGPDGPAPAASTESP